MDHHRIMLGLQGDEVSHDAGDPQKGHGELHLGIVGLTRAGRDGVGGVDGGLLAPHAAGLEDGWKWHQDAMDIDYDPELAAWVSSWTLPADDVGFPVAAATTVPAQPPPVEPIGPDDLLFPDDERPSPKYTDDDDDVIIGHQPQDWSAFSVDDAKPVQGSSVSRDTHRPPRAAAPITSPRQYELDLNDPETLHLYDDVLLLSRKGACGDQLEFQHCGDSRESILHLLAMRFKLDYSYNPSTRCAVIKVPTRLTQQIMSRSEQSIRIICPVSEPQVAEGSVKGIDGEAKKPTTQAGNARRLSKPQSSRRPSVQADDGSNLALVQSPFLGSPPPLDSSSVAETPASSQFGLSIDKDQLRQAFLDNQVGHSLSNRISSWNFFHSGIASKRPRGRRGPLSEKSRKEIKVLEGVGGACWRCRILRRKCDPGDPCKSCPAPHLREDAPPWPLIGCRRGSLTEAMPPQILCPNSSRYPACQENGESKSDSTLRLAISGARSQPEVIAQCFREAEAQRLSDSKLVLGDSAMYLRSRGNSAAANYFSQVLRTGRYRANASLNEPCGVQDKDVSYSELITGMAWELADNRDCLAALEIESIDSFMLLLETASMYEAEVGKSSMVLLSMVCLRHCLDALRLCSANLVAPEFHESCQGERCSINCLRELSSCIYAYIEELAFTMFKKVNLRDRRWWLSTFYSLCIQSYVRRALLVIEQQVRALATDDADLNSAQYLHLITVLFIAVSFQYDPLSVGRLHQSLTEDVAALEATVPELYLASARTVCGVEMWAGEGIKSSYQFLTRMLNIGSLDSVSGYPDIPMMDPDTAPTPASPVSPLMQTQSPRIPQAANGVSFEFSQPSCGSPRSGRPPTVRSFETIFSTPNSSLVSLGKSSIWTQDTILTVPPCGSSSNQRNSIGSILSLVPPPTSASAPGPQSKPLESARLPLLPPPYRKSQPMASASATTPGFVCGCCPKRPQTFQTAEQLRLHEAKKPHICAFCGRRFNRMNEAERHITTIHLRPYSWSCTKLDSPLSAFQRVTMGTDIFDVCGFCGFEFKRTDNSDALSDGDSERLIMHVQCEHKMGECNASKKFYREDLFGQHLKTSHAAEPGVWMKFLENACKTEENTLGQPSLQGSASTQTASDAHS